MTIMQWLTPWEPSVTVSAATMVAIFLFIRGCAKRQPTRWQKFSFWFGLLLCYVVLHTQFDYYAEHEFFMHRLQHLVLHHLGPFLMVLGDAGAVLAVGLPAFASRFFYGLSKHAPVRYAIAALQHPVMAVAWFSGLTLFWLLPPIHFVAMLDWRLYRVMNWSMLINGWMFWHAVLVPGRLRPPRLTSGCRIAMMLAVIPPQIVIGALIFFAPHEIYPVYSLCGRAFDGIDALADQQIGALILWISSPMMSVAGILIVAREIIAVRAR